MSRSIGLSAPWVDYLAKVNPAEHPVLSRCRLETQALPMARMQISPEQGAFMQALVRIMSVKRAFEIGVFTGYSALAVAQVMKDLHGHSARLLACDIDKEWTTKAQEYWREASVHELVELQLAPATDTLNARLKAGESGLYDFGFVDADKTAYDDYYELGLMLLRKGGVMLFDNMLWSGKVTDEADSSPDTVALRKLAMKAREDDRVFSTMSSIGDGVMLIIKK